MRCHPRLVPGESLLRGFSRLVKCTMRIWAPDLDSRRWGSLFGLLLNLWISLQHCYRWVSFGEPKPGKKNLDTKNHHTVQHDFDSNLESVWMLQGCHRKRFTHFQPNRTPGAMAADWSSVQFQNRRGASWNDGGGAPRGLSKGPDSVSWLYFLRFFF